MYPDLGSDLANRLLKEIAASNVQVYYEANAKILVPLEAVEAAEKSLNPKSLFDRFPIKHLI